MKIIRIILSPIVFIFLVCAMSLFPGPLSLMMGIGVLVGNLFEDDKTFHDPVSETLFFTFTWVVYPWIAAKSFIENGTIPD